MNINYEENFSAVTQTARRFWDEISTDHASHITQGLLQNNTYGLSAVMTTTNKPYSRILLRVPINPKRPISPQELMRLSELLSNSLCQITTCEDRLILHSKSALPASELSLPIHTVFTDAKSALNLIAQWNII